MAYTIQQLTSIRMGKLVTVALLGIGILWNLKLTDSYSGCFNADTWNWNKYGELVSKPPRFMKKVARF